MLGASRIFTSIGLTTSLNSRMCSPAVAACPKAQASSVKLTRMLRDRTFSSSYAVASWVLTGVALVLVLQLHVLPALLAGMLVYELVHVIAPTMNKHLSDQRAKLIAVGLLSAVVVMLVTVAIMGVIFFFKSDAGSISALL